ncbi:bifunctional metallophosphatase/5'-nucleotidase [Streptomyces sp. WM6378]|uniref:bifunctional metallophosphatase/5'-nucleotidase n=1 Tax=Streptomyces sp. WM6378 TaxID=1415557 RepID=UPI0006B01E90|nr:bifunctional metallophosphatase/5'-nucleotidase [Streptomyces sp. WM6378]
MRELGRRSFMTAAGSLGALLATGTPAFATPHARDAASAREYVDVQLLSITDLHGFLQSAPGADAVIRGAGGRRYTVGGVAYMATHLERLRAGRANSIFFAPGDLFSGWTLAAESMADEPTIEALNRLGLDFATAGNHEFDRPPGFLTGHMQNGIPYAGMGHTNSFSDSQGEPFLGATFRYYSANAVWRDSGRTVLPPYNIEWVTAPGGRQLPIGFIHLTTLGTERFSTSYQPALATLEEVATVNRYAAELKARGVNTIVLSMHDGAVAGDDFNSATSPSGPAYDLALAVSADIDVIVTGHWHCAFNMMLPDPRGNPRPFVEAGCHGQLINEINLRLDPRTGAVIRALTTSTNHPNTRDVAPDPVLKECADYWTGYANRLGAAPIGRVTASFTMHLSPAGESTMGNLVADWALWAGRRKLDPFDNSNVNPNAPADLALIAVAPRTGRTVIGNGLAHIQSSGGVITFDRAWKAVGYGCPVITATVTGQAIHDALEQQWAEDDGELTYAPLAVSSNVRYAFDAAAPPGERVRPADVLIDGTPLDVRASYRLASTAYTFIGADGYPALLKHTEAVRHTRDFESFTAFVRANYRLAPGPLGRVRAINESTPGACFGTLPPHPYTRPLPRRAHRACENPLPEGRRGPTPG